MITLSWIAYAIFLYYIGTTSGYNSFGIMKVAFSSSRLYLLLGLVTGVNFLIDLSTYSYYMFFMKTLTQALRILVKQKGVINDETLLSPEIMVYYEAYKFALNDGASDSKVKKKDSTNLKNLEKVDRVPIVEMESISSNRDEEEVKIKEKKM